MFSHVGATSPAWLTDLAQLILWDTTVPNKVREFVDKQSKSSLDVLCPSVFIIVRPSDGLYVNTQSQLCDACNMVYKQLGRLEDIFKPLGRQFKGDVSNRSSWNSESAKYCDSCRHGRVAISLTMPYFQQPQTQHNEADNKWIRWLLLEKND